MTKLLLISLMCWAGIPILAADKKPATTSQSALLAQMMEEVQVGGRPPVVRNQDVLAGDPGIVLGELSRYEQHADARVRDRAYTLDWNIGATNTQLAIRRNVVDRLAKACADADSLVWRRAADHLMSFNEEDFTDAAKMEIRKLLATRNNPGILVLCGVAKLRDQMPNLRAIANTSLEPKPHSHGPTLQQNQAWAARLALARLGSKEDIDFCCARVHSDHALILRSPSILEQLAYVRQPEVIPVLREYLDSDEYLPSTRGSGMGVGYAQIAADALAGVIDGFPIQYSGSCASSQEAQKARAWMAERKEFTFGKSVIRPAGLRW